MTDSKEHVLYNKEGTGEQKDEEGKFAFTTDDQDVFEVCFQSKSTGGFSNGNFSTFCFVKTSLTDLVFFTKSGSDSRNITPYALFDEYANLDLSELRMGLNYLIISNYQFVT